MIQSHGRLLDALAIHFRSRPDQSFCCIRQEAQFRLGLSLANAGNRAALKSYLQDLALNDAKLAVDLFERPELRSYLDSEAFRSVFAEARSQAND